MTTLLPIVNDSPFAVRGEHDVGTLAQMANCMQIGNVAAAAIMADGHKGYAQPVGGVIAYEGQISISGVGFDIACGNMAVKLDTPYSAIKDRIQQIAHDINRRISFGVGRSYSKSDTRSADRIDVPLFDDAELWKTADMETLRQKAESQLGTVGAGNHYVDVFREVGKDWGETADDMPVWIGVHFGSRGLGHTSATKYLKLAGGTDGMDVPPTVVDEDSELGIRYIAAMQLGGQYAYAGREWVVEQVRQIIGGTILDTIHNHHNYAWREEHNGKHLWVVRKGATPAFPGQKGFIGGSMGDDAVIIEGVDSAESKQLLYSTVHGAGRLHSRTAAKGKTNRKTGEIIKPGLFTRDQMDAWLREKNVYLVGGDLDESPMAYRRLPDVLKAQGNTIKVLHTLRPLAVVMAGPDIIDPYKD